MDSQTMINLLAALVASLFGWVMHRFRDDAKAQKERSSKLLHRVQQIELLVAGKYVTRNEFDRDMKRVFDKLDSISDKIDRKADK